MGATGGASDGQPVDLPSGIIENTYTNKDKCKTYLALSLFDATTLDANIAAQAINARDKINTFLGKTEDFTIAELAETQFAGIVDSASQLTACLMQKNPQAAAMEYTEDTIKDCEEAWETLTNWALNNGIEVPSEETKVKHLLTELTYITNDPSEVI